MSVIFVGDEGTELALDCGVDISSATVRKIIATPPGSPRKVWDASADGTSGMKYVTGAGDVDRAGVWQLQAYVEMPGFRGYGEVATLTVKNPL